jgi:hypothetical protein
MLPAMNIFVLTFLDTGLHWRLPSFVAGLSARTLRPPQIDEILVDFSSFFKNTGRSFGLVG